MLDRIEIDGASSDKNNATMNMRCNVSEIIFNIMATVSAKHKMMCIIVIVCRHIYTERKDQISRSE